MRPAGGPPQPAVQPNLAEHARGRGLVARQPDGPALAGRHDLLGAAEPHRAGAAAPDPIHLGPRRPAAGADPVGDDHGMLADRQHRHHPLAVGGQAGDRLHPVLVQVNDERPRIAGDQQSQAGPLQGQASERPELAPVRSGRGRPRHRWRPDLRTGLLMTLEAARSQGDQHDQDHNRDPGLPPVCASRPASASAGTAKGHPAHATATPPATRRLPGLGSRFWLLHARTWHHETPRLDAGGQLGSSVCHP